MGPGWAAFRTTSTHSAISRMGVPFVLAGREPPFWRRRKEPRSGDLRKVDGPAHSPCTEGTSYCEFLSPPTWNMAGNQPACRHQLCRRLHHSGQGIGAGSS